MSHKSKSGMIAVGAFVAALMSGSAAIAGLMPVTTGAPATTRVAGIKTFPEIRMAGIKTFPEIRVAGIKTFPEIQVAGIKTFPEIQVAGIKTFPEVVVG